MPSLCKPSDLETEEEEEEGTARYEVRGTRYGARRPQRDSPTTLSSPSIARPARQTMLQLITPHLDLVVALDRNEGIPAQSCRPKGLRGLNTFPPTPPLVLILARPGRPRQAEAWTGLKRPHAVHTHRIALRCFLLSSTWPLDVGGVARLQRWRAGMSHVGRSFPEGCRIQKIDKFPFTRLAAWRCQDSVRTSYPRAVACTHVWLRQGTSHSHTQCSVPPSCEGSMHDRWIELSTVPYSVGGMAREPSHDWSRPSPTFGQKAEALE